MDRSVCFHRLLSHIAGIFELFFAAEAFVERFVAVGDIVAELVVGNFEPVEHRVVDSLEGMVADTLDMV